MNVFADLAKNVTDFAGNVRVVVAITIEAVPARPSARIVNTLSPPVPRILTDLPQTDPLHAIPGPVTVAVTDSGAKFPAAVYVRTRIDA